MLELCRWLLAAVNFSYLSEFLVKLKEQKSMLPYIFNKTTNKLLACRRLVWIIISSVELAEIKRSIIIATVLWMQLNMCSYCCCFMMTASLLLLFTEAIRFLDVNVWSAEKKRKAKQQTFMSVVYLMLQSSLRHQWIKHTGDLSLPLINHWITVLWFRAKKPKCWHHTVNEGGVLLAPNS